VSTSIVEVEIAASPPQVFAALATPRGLSRWLGARADRALAIGTCLDVAVAGTAALRVRVDRLEPPALMVWTCIDGIPEWHESTLRFDLAPWGDATLVRLTHSDWRWREPDGTLWPSGFSWPRQLVRLRKVVRASDGR
jgi:uncharacterized protein YndB with AHSA1/START domain